MGESGCGKTTIGMTMLRLIDPPTGCRFHPRCPVAMDICSQEEPEFKETDPDHNVACWNVNE